MRIAVTGSVATDHLMAFPGRFTEQLLADSLEHVSLSFLVDSLHVRPGGVAANIAIGLGRLGLAPLIVAAVGSDFAEYAVRLKEHGIDIQGILTVPGARTARFLCTTDVEGNQIASFYPGAMSHARDIHLQAVIDAAGGTDLVLIAPDDPEAMLQHTHACRTSGTRFAADPSQQLARLDGESIKGLVNGATYLFTNTYERALLLQRTGWKEETVTERVGTWITTLGADGIRIDRAGLPTLYVPAADVEAIADPTGAGDAFRSGFLAATAWGLDLLTAARTGCALAAAALETVGTQDYPTHLPSLTARLNRSYGAPTAQALRPHARRQGAQP